MNEMRHKWISIVCSLALVKVRLGMVMVGVQDLKQVTMNYFLTKTLTRMIMRFYKLKKRHNKVHAIGTQLIIMAQMEQNYKYMGIL
jgi:hypothetical protein